jgi:hypothetical protein
MAAMPSHPQAASVPRPLSPPLALAQASRALWLATLSLMTAFMQTPAPAHRVLLARRISRNFDTLSRQECFEAGCRATFERLASRWQSHAEAFAVGEDASGGGHGLVRALWPQSAR